MVAQTGSCTELESEAQQVYAEGRLDATVRILRDAQARCASERFELLATAVAELAAPGDPRALLDAANDAHTAGRLIEARKGFSRALAAFERAHGTTVRVGVPSAMYTQPIATRGGTIAFARGRTIRISNSNTWAPHRIFTRAGDTDVSQLALSLDATLVAAAYGGTVVIWNIETGAIAHQLEVGAKHVEALAWTDDALVSASNNALKLWNPRTGGLVKTIAMPGGASALTITGGSAFVAPYRGPIGVFDLARGTRVRSIDPPKGQVMKLELSADGKTLAVSADDSPGAAVHVYDVASGRRRRAFSLIGNGTMSPDGKWLAGSHETGLQVFDLARGTPILDDKLLQRPQFLASGTLIALDDHGSVIAVDLKTRAKLPVLPVARAPSRIDFASDTRVVVLTRSGIEICELGRLACREVAGAYRDVAWNGETLAAIRDDNGSVEVWNGKLERVKQLLTSPPDHMIPQHNNLLAMSRDGRRAVSSEYQLHVLDLRAGTETRFASKLDAHEGLAISPDGRLAAAMHGPNVKVYDLDRGSLVVEIKVQGEPRALAFSHDGKQLAMGTRDAITLHDLALGATGARATFTLSKHARVTSLAFAPDGKRLVAGMDRVGQILALPELRTIATLPGHDLPVFDVAYRRDGRVVATVAADEGVRLWSSDGKPIGTLGFVGGDSAYFVDTARERVELYGNARRHLTCDIGTASFAFELCEDRVAIAPRGLAPAAPGTVEPVAPPTPSYRREEDLVFQRGGRAAAIRLVERTRENAWLSRDGKTIVTSGGGAGSILAAGRTTKLDAADAFEVRFSPDESKLAVVQARASFGVFGLDGKRLWTHQHGIGCAARWQSSDVLTMHDDNDGFLWRVDLRTQRATKLGNERRADACWASNDGRRWFVRDDFAKRGGVIWRIDGETGAATIWAEGVDDIVASRDADRLCYARARVVFCRRDGAAEERVAADGSYLQLDDTGRVLVFASYGVFFVADTSARTVRALSDVKGHSGGVTTLLSGGGAFATGSGSGVEVFDLAARTRIVVPGSAFYGVRPLPGRPRSLLIEKEVSVGQDLYLAELP